ncbi:hypothetical protein DSECCO2_518950 [anaerobic digester metagenome]
MNDQIAGWSICKHGIAVIVIVLDQSAVDLVEAGGYPGYRRCKFIDAGFICEIHSQLDVLMDCKFLSACVVAKGIDLDGNQPEITEDHGIAVFKGSGGVIL